MDIDFNIIRSKTRKSVSLQIMSGKLIVRAPDFISELFIEKLLVTKQRWIKDRLLLDQQKYFLRQSNLSNLSKYLVNGDEYIVNIIKSDKNNVKLTKNIIVIELLDVSNNEIAVKILKKWFAEQTKALVRDRCSLYSKQMGLYPKQILVRSYKARWGCCKSNQVLVFNQLLYMAPLYVVDAVVVHELAHLKYKNHSRCFWGLVYSFCLDYKKANDWLNYHKYQLYIA